MKTAMRLLALWSSFSYKEDLTALDTNMVVMQIFDAAKRSASTGRTVKLEPLPQ